MMETDRQSRVSDTYMHDTEKMHTYKYYISRLDVQSEIFHKRYKPAVLPGSLSCRCFVKRCVIELASELEMRLQMRFMAPVDI